MSGRDGGKGRNEFRGIDRRDVLLGAGALAASAAAAMADHHGGGHDHDGHGHDGHAHHGHDSKRNPAMAAVVANCVSAGQICISHCIEAYQNGDQSLGDCAFAVQQMLPVCNATAQLAALGSDQLASLTPVCIEVCKRCEKECRAHEKHHEECRNCAEACAALIAALEKTA